MAFFNDILKQEKFDIYVPEEHRALFEEFERVMHEDLVEFNKNKDQNVTELLQKIPDVNLAESLQILNDEGLFDLHTKRTINMALFLLYFTSVDYKPPEKKVPEQNPDLAQDGNQGDGGDGNAQPDGDGEPKDGDDDEPKDGDGDAGADGGDQPADGQAGGDQGAGDQPQGDGGDQGDGQPQQQPEEEWKAPEITEEDLLMVKAREKLRLVFVPTKNPEDQAHDKPLYDSVLRMRMPLDRELHTVRSQDTHVSASTSKFQKVDLKAKAEEKKQSATSKTLDQKTEESKEEPPIEEKKELPPEPEDFIEPYDGKTFEKHRAFFPGN